MKREILFRGKDKATDQWVYGDYTHNEGLNTHYISRNVNNTSRKAWEVDPDTIGQYTGLKDKNGKQIFEGDIIKLKDFDFFDEEYKEIKGVVEYSVDRFIIVAGKIEFDLSVYYDTKCKIIGNITDTPELMK